MDWISAIGFGAALCSTISFVPQAWRIVRTRDTGGLSAPMYSITSLGFLLWLAYGVARREWPLILTNGICLVLASFILVMIVLPARRKDRIAKALDPDSPS